MYLEVHIESSEPQVYPLEKSELLIGSMLACDIRIDVDSVSKKHLKIMNFEEKWFIVDQGSTNGTYIDTEQLIPGQRKQISEHLYVRLGDTVHICLVTDPDETHAPPPKHVPKPQTHRLADDKTRVISLKALTEASAAPKTAAKTAPKKPGMKDKKEARSHDIASETKAFLEKRKQAENRPKSVSSKTIITAAIILLVGYVLNKQFTKDLEINKINAMPTNVAPKGMDKSRNAADRIE